MLWLHITVWIALEDMHHVSGRMVDFPQLMVGCFPSQGNPSTSMRDNMVARVRAEELYRRTQAAQRISRALNSKPQKQTQFFPGDLVYYKRYKAPAQSLSRSGVDVTGIPTLSRWYGPARILATETKRTEGQQHVSYRPGHIVWLVAGGRLKRCSIHQIRHCSERERLLAEASGGFMTYPWSFTDLIHKVEFGRYDNYDDLEDEYTSGASGLLRSSIPAKVPRSRGRPREQAPLSIAARSSGNGNRPIENIEEMSRNEQEPEEPSRTETRPQESPQMEIETEAATRGVGSARILSVSPRFRSAKRSPAEKVEQLDLQRLTSEDQFDLPVEFEKKAASSHRPDSLAPQGSRARARSSHGKGELLLSVLRTEEMSWT